jgi:four helix bundle protein
MPNAQSSPNGVNPKRQYDLEERTGEFSKRIIDFCRVIPTNHINIPIVSQLVRSGTSIGANYCEADEASSKKDFVNKISIANKETKETKYWLKILAHTVPEKIALARILWKEAQELNLIFSAIIRSSRKISH